MRLDDGNHLSRDDRTGRLEDSRDLDRMVTVIIDDGYAVLFEDLEPTLRAPKRGNSGDSLYLIGTGMVSRM